MRTFIPKKDEIEQKWWLVDADGRILGRLATEVADLIRGKRKPQFVRHMDTGDFVVVVNAANVYLSGKKPAMKTYWRNTGYPGGNRITQFKDVLAKNPEFIITHAVRGMLPHNRLGRRLIKKLKVYAGPEHPHAAQKPQVLEL